MGDTVYIIERALASSGACDGCGAKIVKGELRLNTRSWNNFTQSWWNKRRHVGCVTGRVALNTLKQLGGISALKGFDELTEEEKRRIEDLWLSAISEEATEGLAREKIGNKRKQPNGCQKEAIGYIEQHAPGMMAALKAEAGLVAEEEERLENEADPEKLARKNRRLAKTKKKAAVADFEEETETEEEGDGDGEEEGKGAGLGAAATAGRLAAPPAPPAAAAALIPPPPLQPQPLPGMAGAPGIGVMGMGVGMGVGLPQMAQLPPAQLLAINAYLQQLLLARQAAGGAAEAAGGPDAAAAAAVAAGVIKPEQSVTGDQGVKPEPPGMFTTATAAALPPPPLLPVMAPAADISPLLGSPQLLAPGTPARQLSAVLATATTAGGGSGGDGVGYGDRRGYAANQGGGDGGAAQPQRVSTRRRKAPVMDDVFVYGAEAEVEAEPEAASGWGGSGAPASPVKARGGRGRGRGRGGRRGRAAAEEEDPDFVLA